MAPLSCPHCGAPVGRSWFVMGRGTCQACRAVVTLPGVRIAQDGFGLLLCAPLVNRLLFAAGLVDLPQNGWFHAAWLASVPWLVASSLVVAFNPRAKKLTLLKLPRRKPAHWLPDDVRSTQPSTQPASLSTELLVAALFVGTMLVAFLVLR